MHGPFACFEPILQAWRSRHTGPMPKVLGFSIYGIWLILYMAVMVAALVFLDKHRVAAAVILAAGLIVGALLLTKGIG